MGTTYPIRYRRNVVSTYVTAGVLAALALATTPLLARNLGKEGYGIWVLVASFALYLEVLEFGFGKATPKFVAEYEARADPRGLRGVIATSFWILAGLGALAGVVGVIIAALFGSLFDLSPGLADAARVLVLLIMADLALSIPMDTFGGTLMGLQRFYLVNTTLVAVALAQAIGWVIVLSQGGGLVELGVVTVVLSLLGQFARFLLARRHVAGLKLSPRLIDSTVANRFTRISGWFFLLDLSKLVLIRLDVVVVGLVVGVPAAGVYAVGQRLTLALEYLVEPLTKAFFPHAAAIAAHADEVGLRRTLMAGTRLSLAIAAPTALALGFLSGPLLELWLGSGFEDAGTVVVLLGAGIVAAAITRTGLIMLQGIGQVRIPALFSFAEALLNLALSVVLARTMGLAGVALGSLLATVLVNLGAFYPWMCRQFGLPMATLSGALARAHVPALAVGCAAGAGALTLDPSGVSTIGCAAMIAAAYGAVFFFTGLTQSERQRLVGLVRP